MQIAYSFPNRHFPVHAFTVACCKRMTSNLPQIRARQGKVTFPHPRLQLVRIRDCYKNERLASPLCFPPSLLSSLGRDSGAPAECISLGAAVEIATGLVPREKGDQVNEIMEVGKGGQEEELESMCARGDHFFSLPPLNGLAFVC